jgi:hypothetical protein
VLNKSDVVKTITSLVPSRSNGIITYIACYAATSAGGKTCDKKSCQHTSTHAWVKWEDGKTFSYSLLELELDLPSKEVVKEKQPSSIEKFKSVVKEKSTFDFDLYCGYTQVKYDRNGQPHLIKMGVSEVEIAITAPIKQEDLDYDQYNYLSGKPMKKK